MKGLIICYSTTGNTRLVADQIALSLCEKQIETIVRDPVIEPKFDDIHKYDIVGFGAPTMAWKPAYGFFESLGLVPKQNKSIPAFVFCTSGGQPLNTLRIMSQTLSKKNFIVISGIEIIAETNWPMSRQLGKIGEGYIGRPNKSDLELIPPFVEKTSKILESRNITSEYFPFRLHPLHFVGQFTSSKDLRRSMGIKILDKNKCVQCAKCAAHCSSKAISLDPFPVFSNRCSGCWSCYNICPTGAISTLLTGRRGVYNGPVKS
ncbi:MAG: EFR1 family ferrodoxin [Desulfobacterales bacterium]|nr:EFR1 family ferrodoxin [Desulfobacterales bacterium]